MPGVVHVFTHENRPDLAWFDRKWKDGDSPKGSPFRPLYDAEIQFAMQPIALVIGETFEAARCGARMLEVDYQVEPHETSLRARRNYTYTPGNEKAVFNRRPNHAAMRIRRLPKRSLKSTVNIIKRPSTTNPMEMHATTVIYHEGDTLSVYDKNRVCSSVRITSAMYLVCPSRGYECLPRLLVVVLARDCGRNISCLWR